jgi:hypothetical protein
MIMQKINKYKNLGSGWHSESVRHSNAKLFGHAGGLYANELKQLSVSEKINLGTKGIAKNVRDQLKKEFPNCEFSVTKKEYSGGSSISIDLMRADFKVIKDFKDISERALHRYENISHYTPKQIEEMQNQNYHQLNHNIGEYDPDEWNNGVFLTEKGHNLFKRVMQITNQYNWDNSDIQTDYFDVNFYTHLGIGKWDKPFKQD